MQAKMTCSDRDRHLNFIYRDSSPSFLPMKEKVGYRDAFIMSLDSIQCSPKPRKMMWSMSGMWTDQSTLWQSRSSPSTTRSVSRIIARLHLVFRIWIQNNRVFQFKIGRFGRFKMGDFQICIPLYLYFSSNYVKAQK